jgi:hypothetical protein
MSRGVALVAALLLLHEQILTFQLQAMSLDDRSAANRLALPSNHDAVTFAGPLEKPVSPFLSIPLCEVRPQVHEHFAPVLEAHSRQCVIAANVVQLRATNNLNLSTNFYHIRGLLPFSPLLRLPHLLRLTLLAGAADLMQRAIHSHLLRKQNVSSTEIPAAAADLHPSIRINS